MKIAPEVQSTLVTAGLVIAGGLVAYYFARKVVVASAKAVGTAVDPLNENNLASTAAKNIVGEKKLVTWFEKIFATIDLINPFNEDDTLAKEIAKDHFQKQDQAIADSPIASTLSKLNPVNAVYQFVALFSEKSEKSVFENDDELYKAWEKYEAGNK